MIYLELLIGFLKVGCFSFGGAYSAIPLVRDMVMSHGWMDESQLTYMIAVSESTPGPIMVNFATFIGNTQGGILGAVIATLAVITPAFLIILFVTKVMDKFIKNKYMQATIGGLIPSVTGLISATGIYMAISHCISAEREIKVDLRSLIMTAVLTTVLYLSKKLFKKKISPIMLIIISAVFGIGLYAV